MKNKKLSTVLKEKKFYLSLFVGILAIGAIVYFSMTPTTENKDNLADLNEPATEENTDTNLAENDNLVNNNTELNSVLEQETKEPLQTMNPQEVQIEEKDVKEANADTDNETKKKTKTSKNEKVAKADKEQEKETKQKNTTKTVSKTTTKKEAAQQEEAVTVMQSDTKPLDNLKFNQETGLLWPVVGDVILNYNAEGVVYFPTLAQYKSNPAIIISSKVGTEVLSSAKCKVIDITKNEETGLTVTTSIGDGYQVIYGQLKDVTAKVGDILEEGDVLGYVAEPTKYYVVEGSNLYYKIMEDDASVNPLLLLR